MSFSLCFISHAARILTSEKDIHKFLDGFKRYFKVKKLEPNPDAQPGGWLFERYKDRMLSLPKHLRQTQLGFHGTAEKNIPSICKQGFNPNYRGAQGQVHGTGEYFATTPSMPLDYCHGGHKMLLNELLLGRQDVDHTRTPNPNKHKDPGDIIVMKDPVHDLPRYVITFEAK